jgi:hypothetical protein
MTERQQVIDVMDSIIDLWYYYEHDVHCEFAQCDVCTCGLTQKRNRLREVYNRLCQTSVNS